MTRIEVHNRVSDFNSYRAARVKSLFNAENGCNFDLEIDADLSGEWGIGVVVGPSGSGKTSIGRTIFGEDKIYDYTQGWAQDKPVIDCIAPDGDFNEVTGALANVGLGSVPSCCAPSGCCPTVSSSAWPGPDHLREAPGDRHRRVHLRGGPADSPDRLPGVSKGMAAGKPRREGGVAHPTL